MKQAFAAVAILFGLSGTGLAQQPCATYTVRADDTLREISNRAYGDSGNYQLIYDANRSIIGADPASLTSGLLINIPCQDGTISTTDFVPYAEPEEARQSGGSTFIAPFQKAIRIAVEANSPPFSGKNLPEGGMIAELVRQAVTTEDPDREINLVFVEDLSQNLDTVFKQGRFDLALPIFLPDCRNVEPLSPADTNICRNYYSSRPIYEVIIGMYAAPSSKYLQAQTLDDLAGATICRPRNQVDFDLRQAGLVEPKVTYLKPENVSECVMAVVNGSADIFSINTIEAEKVINAWGQADNVSEIDSLSTRLPLHVVTPRNNPLGRPYLTYINNGFWEVIETGQWFAIAAKHIKDFREGS